MSRFAEFLSDIKWAFFAGFGVFILSMGSIMFVSMDAKSNSEARIRFYQFFTHESTPEYAALPEGMFVGSLRTLFNNEEEALARMWAYRTLHDNDTIRSFDRTFAAMGVEEGDILVQGNIPEVNVLIEKEQKLHKEYEDNLRGFRFSWTVLSLVVWQVASVIFLFRFWWSESLVMAYFPHAQWWFWLYSLLAFPWSLSLWCAIVLSRRWYKRAATRSRARNSTEHREYENTHSHGCFFIIYYDAMVQAMEHATQPEAKTLLAINGIFGFALSLGGIFLQVFLFTLGGFHAVIEYNLVSACALMLFYILSGLLLNRISSRRLLLIGIAAYALLFLLLFLFREKSLDFLIPFGFINGAAMGIFWAAATLLQYILTTGDTRYTFFGKQSFWFSITGGVAPIIGGAIISLVGSVAPKDIGYSVVFFAIALLMGVLYHTAGTLPDHGTINFSMRDVLTHRRSKLWVYVLVMEFCNGLFDFIFISFGAVIMFLIVKEEFFLGVINAAGAIVAAGAGLAAIRVLKRNRLAFIPASFIAAIGIGLFAWQQNWWGLAGLIFLFSAAMPILGVESSKALFDVVDRSGGGWQKKYHLFLERENALGLGRVTSLLVCFFLITDQNQLNIARSALGVIAFIPIIVAVILYRIFKIMGMSAR